MQLNKGISAPEFSLKDQNGKRVTKADFAGSKVLIYFYPKADTPGCTEQACSVNLSLSSLNSAGMKAVGISPDSPGKQKAFADKFSLHFPLLSDPDHAVAEEFGVWGTRHNESGDYEGIIRSSFVMDENGYIIQSNYNIDPFETVTRAEQLLMLY